MITRTRLTGTAVATGWLLISLLPWWQVRVDSGDPFDTGARTIDANVWRASTPAALAVVIAAAVSVALVATRAHPPQSQEHRGTGLVIAYLPVLLLCWAAWSIDRPAAGQPDIGSFTMTFIDEAPADDYQVLHDRLQILTISGFAEGPAWGSYVGITLILAATAWAALRLLP